MAIPILPLIGLAGQLIDKVFPDPKLAAKAKAELAQMEQDGELKELETRMSAIVMEAQSKDPWTSRARPSFLYVIYIMLLLGIPAGFASIWFPNEVATMSHGFKEWLASIPEWLYGLFISGYLGYSAARSYDKRKILEGKK
jgi:hypothetical protein